MSENNKERTLIVIKPHVFQDLEKNAYEGAIQIAKEAYKKLRLEVIYEKSHTFSDKEAFLFYREHLGKTFFQKLLKATISGLCWIMVLEGEDAIQKVRDLHGPSDQSKLKPQHLRYVFARDEEPKGPNTGLHASDSKKSFNWESFVLKIELE